MQLAETGNWNLEIRNGKLVFEVWGHAVGYCRPLFQRSPAVISNMVDEKQVRENLRVARA